MRSVYLDYNATTPLDPKIQEAMSSTTAASFGNPSSVHHIGRAARALLDDCRYRVASLWQCKPSEVIFTSGGTESNNLAVFGAARSLASKGRHLITSNIEHHAVLNAFKHLASTEGFELSLVPVDSAGFVHPEDLISLIRSDTVLVSVMAANNETGAIQPYTDLSHICRKRGITFHCDAVQAVGKLEFHSIQQFGADLVSVCSHKLHGPKGAGALFCRSPLRLSPLLRGGAHENENRAGTENLAAILGFTLALEHFVRPSVFDASLLCPLSRRLIESLADIPGVDFQGPPNNRLANTVVFTVSGWDSISLLAALDLEGICASSGSACSVGSLEPSHVLLAMGLPRNVAASLVRFSLGRDTSEADILQTIDVFQSIVSSSRLPE
ncbi:MAG: Cysteine desulfurase IscS [Verrucomicrobia subdivision 3 bacterium]|nr:Cysteine desulfurase IscS [Limisphaerales bacterium]MCS1415858.1 Cysteine desulfurase IscS [Limisphaerales bacterium]